MNTTNGGADDREPVTVGPWSGPLEGTYEDSSAGPPEGLRAVATEPALAAPADGVVIEVAQPPVSLTKGPRRVDLVKRARDQRSRWAAFGPEPVRPPGRVHRVLMPVWRVVGHEWSLAGLAALALAVVMTWPALVNPTTTMPHDLDGPPSDAWRLAWIGHALTSDPGRLWNGNAFHPERYSVAFSDTLLGYAPFSLLGNGLGAAILRYNVFYVLAFALAFLGGFALARQLGATRVGAAVAAAACAFAPWRWGQGGHLDVLSTGGILLALAMLARGHGFSLRDGYRSARTRPRWALAGWLAAAWQISLGFATGLPFAYGLAGLAVLALAAWALTRRTVPRWVLVVDLVGGVLFAGAWVACAYPYLRVLGEHPETRPSRADLDLYSAPAHGFLIGPAASWPWGHAHAGLRAGLAAPTEGALLLGYVLMGLVVAGLVYSVWPQHVRILLLIGMAGSALLAMGTRAPFEGELSYLVLYQYLPGWNALPAPGHLVVWTTLFAGLLAAGAVSAFGVRVDAFVRGRVPARPGALLQAAMVLPLILVLVEGIPRVAHHAVPRPPAALAGVEAPVLLLPTGTPHDSVAMLWSVDGFPALVNGDGDRVTSQQREVREIVRNFPDTASISRLRDLGVRTVIVVKALVGGTPYAGAAEAPADGLDVTRDETEDAVVFRLSPTG